MESGLADFIERHMDSILAQAIEFAKTVEVGSPLDADELRDHLPEIVRAVISDLRTPQTRAQEFAKSQGRAPVVVGDPRSAAGTHALHRAHSGYSISNLVSEYRALRASVLRLWAQAPESVAAPEEITRFNEAIDQAIAESVSHYAAEVERWRNIFLGVLGHDLRSPLGAIVMTSELIARMAVDAPIASAAQTLIRSGERMRELLDNLLVYNRAQMGVGFEVDKVQVDLARACRDEIDMLQTSMPGSPILFEAPVSLIGHFDVGRIREALANLVVNASKYGTRGGQIRVELRDESDGPELTVSNAGDPIARDSFDLMFEPLRRGGVSEGESERASLGLGLFIVSQIARAHGGTIRGESSNGKTTFTLHLPRQPG